MVCRMTMLPPGTVSNGTPAETFPVVARRLGSFVAQSPLHRQCRHAAKNAMVHIMCENGLLLVSSHQSREGLNSLTENIYDGTSANLALIASSSRNTSFTFYGHWHVDAPSQSRAHTRKLIEIRHPDIGSRRDR